MTYYISKRKLNQAIKNAIEGGKIPDSPYQFYSVKGDEYGLHWPEKNLTAQIKRRFDNTIFISHSMKYDPTSIYAKWLEPWDGPIK